MNANRLTRSLKMKRIHYPMPEGETHEFVDQVNEMIAQGKPDDDILHYALTGLFEIVASIDSRLKRVERERD